MLGKIQITNKYNEDTCGNPDFITVRLDSEYVIPSSSGYNIMKVILVRKRDYTIYLDFNDEEVNTKSYVTLSNFLKSVYPKGFYIAKVKDNIFTVLASVNNDKVLVDTNGNEIQFPRELLKIISKIVPLYKNKIKLTDSNIEKIKIISKHEIKENGKRNIVYVITDGRQQSTLDAKKLKENIRAKSICVVNAKLTKNNRLLVKYE